MGGLRVVVLFSGGGAPGMNALLRSIVRLGRNRHRAVVFGARNGFAGLVSAASRVESGQVTEAVLLGELESPINLPGPLQADQDLVRLDYGSVSGPRGRGGTILGTATCAGFQAPDVRRGVVSLLKSLNVNALVVCGGDGSLNGASLLASESDLMVVGIPVTIDDDLPMTEMALGVDTALNNLNRAVENSHGAAVGRHRIRVLEVMGRHSGGLARMAALVLGAEIVVTPEGGPMTMEKIRAIAQRLERSLLRGGGEAVVLVAAGVSLDPSLAEEGEANAAVRLARELEKLFQRDRSLFPGLEVQAAMLDHLHRAWSPSIADRLLAARFAEAAWEAISRPNERSGVLGLRHGSILLQDFHVPFDVERIEAAQKLSRLQTDLGKSWTEFTATPATEHRPN